MHDNDDYNEHTPIVRSASADTPFCNNARKHLRRRSKSVIKIRQVPSFFMGGTEKYA